MKLQKLHETFSFNKGLEYDFGKKNLPKTSNLMVWDHSKLFDIFAVVLIPLIFLLFSIVECLIK